MMGSRVLMHDSLPKSTAPATESATSYSYASFLTNYPLMSALLAIAFAQSSKFVYSWYKENRWDLKQLVGSGGMPSSHSATVAALAVAVGLQEGFGGSPFAVAVILALVVMYDATGVRLHAGRQAEVLNQIIYELPADHPLAGSRPLHELLGQTPLQVAAGALLGLVTAAIVHLIYKCGCSWCTIRTGYSSNCSFDIQIWHSSLIVHIIWQHCNSEIFLVAS